MENTSKMEDNQVGHNFHTHTFRCKHAKGDAIDYAERAVELGMHTLGISDHSALPDDRWIQARMHYEDLSEYIGAIDLAKARYPELKILQGMECEYLPEYKDWYADELLGKQGFEYLIGAAHFFPDEDEWVGTYGGTVDAKTLDAYAKYTIDMMATGYFAFIAHPDLFGNSYSQWDTNTAACARDICAAAADLNVPLEINALGIRKQESGHYDSKFPLYPWLPFWEEAAQHDLEIIVTSDAHRPKDLQVRAGAAMQIAIDLGLKHTDVEGIGKKN